MKRILMILMSLAITSGVALADADGGRSLSVRTFQFKFKEPDKAAAIIKPLLSADGSMSIQPSNGALVVTDHAENLKAIAAAIGEYDAPARGVKLSLRLVGAGRVDAGAPPRVADELRDVAQKLAMLRYNTFENLGHADLEGREGDPGLVDLETGYRAEFRFGEYDPASDSIKLTDFRLSRLQGEKKDQLVPLYKATLNVKVGQTLIVGASRSAGNRALMIVVVAKR